MLESYVRERRQGRDILLMSHIVLGYPSFDTSLRVIEKMVESGVDLMELQIPFSEPIADGPVILQANARALAAGSTVRGCLDLASAVTKRFDIPFLFITYYNVLFRFGVEAFVNEMAERGIRGAIVPDLPPEEGEIYLEAMRRAKLEPIMLYSPNTTDVRLRYLAQYASGFVYCVARKGVTGAETTFSNDMEAYLGRCRAATKLPLAVGFGVKERRDVDYLIGKADIAIVGSETHRVLDRDGVDAVGPFIAGLRAERA
jgi:tryptophan synthase alpha chain